MKLMWLAHSRPDVAYSSATAAQVTGEQWDSSRGSSIKRLNATVKRLHNSREESMFFPRLGLDTLRILVYADASFGNNEDLSSQMGYVLFLTDDQNKSAPMSYKSVKCKRVTRSVLVAEAIAFAEGFDQGYALENDLRESLQRRVPLTMFTDSKTLFEVITKASYTSEKRILIDLACVREAYARLDIDVVQKQQHHLTVA
jgi:hypothetical protein